MTVSSGWMHYVAGKIDSVFVDGISSGQGHHDERSGCVTDFSRMFGGGSPLDVKDFVPKVEQKPQRIGTTINDPNKISIRF